MPEELEIEFQVRGISRDQVGAEQAFINRAKQEAQSTATVSVNSHEVLDMKTVILICRQKGEELSLDMDEISARITCKEIAIIFAIIQHYNDRVITTINLIF